MMWQAAGVSKVGMGVCGGLSSPWLRYELCSCVCILVVWFYCRWGGGHLSWNGNNMPRRDWSYHLQFIWNLLSGVPFDILPAWVTKRLSVSSEVFSSSNIHIWSTAVFSNDVWHSNLRHRCWWVQRHTAASSLISCCSGLGRLSYLCILH